MVIPGASWAEKAGTFQNVDDRLQAFERAIAPLDYCKGEAQIALDLSADLAGTNPAVFNPATTRKAMAETHGLREFITNLHLPAVAEPIESDMEVMEV